MNVIQRFFEPVLRAKFMAFQQIFKGALTAINPFVHIYFIEKLVRLLEAGSQESFFTYILYYIIYVLLYEGLFWCIYSWGWYRAVPCYMGYLAKKHMQKYVELDNNVTERIGTGKTISIIEKGIDIWAKNLDMFLWNFSNFCVILIGVTYIVFSLSFIAGIAFFVVYIGIFFFAIFLNKRMIQYRKQRTEQMHLFSKHMVKIIMSKLEILQNQKSLFESERLTRYTQKAAHYNIKMSPYFHAIFQTPQFIVILIKLVAFYILARLIFAGDLDIAQFVVIFGVMTVLENTIVRFVIFFKDFTKEFVTIERMWEFFDSTPSMSGYEKGETFMHKNGDISLKNISYGYDENKNVFNKFSLDIPEGTITALVGPSGGGKSTLVKLISGYIRQDSGDILIDSQNLKDVSLKSYYKDVGYLTQEPSVFDGTVKENLLYAVGGDIEEKEIKKVIKLAHCEFIYELKDGLDTEIGERGVKLSGGQKQRLAIAKIFLKNPKIIILDEPTSALDSLSEQKITKAMYNLFKGRTVLVIAHRLQTVKNADDIIVIEDGKVIERGTHNSLIRKQGYYKQMLDLQSGF